LCVQVRNRLDLLKAEERGICCRCCAQHCVMFENVGAMGGLRWQYMYRHGRRRRERWRVGVFVTSNGLSGEKAVVKLTSRKQAHYLEFK
jgi:hypothetical protein